MTRLSDFPDAPLGSYVCEEGWLIVGDQAWTESEWRATPRESRPRDRRGPAPKQLVMPQRGNRYATEAEARSAQRRTNREHMRRVRAARGAA